MLFRIIYRNDYLPLDCSWKVANFSKINVKELSIFKYIYDIMNSPERS